MTAINLSSLKDFTLETCHAVAWQNAAAQLSPQAMQRMTEARKRFQALIEDPSVTIYGVTSGYGQNAKTRLTPEERKAHAKQPPIAATPAWGEPVPERVARAIVFARLANFIEGHAGISPSVAEALARLLEGGPLPSLPSRGQGGAGEIMSLSHLFLELARREPMAEKDVLALVNGSPAATGLAADAALASSRRLQLAARVLAFAAEAFNAPLEHLAPELESYWNNPHDAWALSTLRGLIDGGHKGTRRPYQAPVSFRIMPRILGQARRASVAAEEVARESLQAVTDNPVLLPPDAMHPFGQAISTGGYHNPHVPMTLDQITASLANLLVIVERMTTKMLDGQVSLLSPQLGVEEGLSYLGCLPMALVGLQEEARMLAYPTLLPGSESGGFGQNDVASPVFAAWSKQERAGILLEHGLAMLAAVSLRAYRVTTRPVPASLQSLRDEIERAVPHLDCHEPIGGEMAALAQVWRQNIYAS